MGSVQRNGGGPQAVENLRFQMNVAEEVALKFRDGRDVEGRYGPQVMFTLTDDRKMYLDPNVADSVRELGLEPGERISIVKRPVRQGRKQVVEWEVRRVDPAGVSGAYDEPETRLERDLRGSIDEAERRKAETQSPGAASAYTAPSLASIVSLHAATMTTMLRASVDALMSVESYAKKQHGIKLHFNEEDVRTVAATLYIQANRDGAR